MQQFSDPYPLSKHSTESLLHEVLIRSRTQQEDLSLYKNRYEAFQHYVEYLGIALGYNKRPTGDSGTIISDVNLIRKYIEEVATLTGKTLPEWW
jgi:hypothetical protein